MPAKNAISQDVWHRYADLYELGFLHACEIAERLGVSPQVVSRQMKKMGARKGSRSHQTVVDLEAFLQRRARREYLMGLSDLERRKEQQRATEAVLDKMMEAIMIADRVGDLTLANDQIEKTADAFGVKISRRKGQRKRG